MTTRLPHQVGATEILTLTSGIPFPEDLPDNGQILAYSGTIGRMVWANQGSGSGSAIETRDEGFVLDNNTEGFDFVGAGVTATLSGSLIRVEIPGGGTANPLETYDEGALVDSTTEKIDFVGTGVTATASGSFVRIEIPGATPTPLETYDEGILVDATTDKIDFRGAGITATASGSFVRVEVNATPFELYDEGILIDATTEKIDFVGDGVTATASGSLVRVEIPRYPLLVLDEGISLLTDPPFIDFVGGGVSATVSGGGIRITIASGTGGSGSALAIRDENGLINSAAEFIDFAGGGVVATNSGLGVHIEIPALVIKDEGVNISNPANSINFTGGGITATAVGNAVTVNVDGPIAAAKGAYIKVTLTTNSINPSNNTDIPFTSVIEQRGELALVSNQVQGLKAGRTYHIQASFLVTGDVTNDALGADIWNVTAGAAFTKTNMQGWRASGVTFSDNVMPFASHIFTPLIDTTVSVRVRDKNGTVDVDHRMTYLEVTEIGAVQANVIGGMEFMDSIVVGANTTTLTFGTGGNGIYNRALDGDVDEEYILKSYIVRNGGGTPSYELRPNNLTTNQHTFFFADSSTTSFVSQAGTNFYVHGGTANGDIMHSQVHLWAKTGRIRIGHSIGGAYDTSPAGGVEKEDSTFFWNDTTTNITSLVINATSASAIGIGSTFELYRRTPQNTRADSASTHERNIESAVDPNALATTEQTTGAATFNGSVVGVSVRLEEAVTAGTITVNVKVAGVTTLSAVLNTTNTTYNRASAVPGVHKFNPGDNISVEIVPASYINAGNIISGITVNVMMVTTGLFQPVDITRNVTSIKTSAYTAAARDYVRCDPTTATFPVTLPLAASNPNAVIWVKHVSDSVNTVSVVPTGSDTIDGISNAPVVEARDEFSYTSNGGTDWMVG